MYSQMLDEFPLRDDQDELRRVKRAATNNALCCIGLFALLLLMAWMHWKSLENERLLNLENLSLRVKMSAMSETITENAGLHITVNLLRSRIRALEGKQ